MVPFAIYTSKFPLRSTTFIQREIRAFIESGFTPNLIANHRPDKNDFHSQDTDLMNATCYLDELPLLSLIAEHIRLFIRNPLRWFHTFTFFLSGCTNLKLLIDRLKQFWASGALSFICHKKHIIHIHVHFAFGAATSALFWSKLTNNSYSISIHGSDVLLPRDLTKTKIENAKYIISNCHFHTTNLPKRFPGMKKCKYYIVPISLDLTNPPWTENLLPNNDGILRIFAVGRLIEVKAFHILISASINVAKQGKKLICRIAGDGPLLKSLQQLITSYGGDSIVTLLGPLSEHEVAQEMAQAHVIGLTSISEGTPMCLIEAMAKARPVFAPRITAIPEIVDNGNTGYLFDPESIDSCSSVIMRYIDMTNDDLIAMGSKGREKAIRTFDIRTNIKQLISIHSNELTRSYDSIPSKNCEEI